MNSREAEGLTRLTVMYSRAWFVRVFIEITYDEDEGFKLVELRRLEGSMSGSGREVLAMLCDAADMLNEKVTLECSVALVKYYGSFGFLPSESSGILCRLPRRVNHQSSGVSR